MKYLFLDTETGGLSENTSLLTLGMIITDGTFSILDQMEWKLKPNEGMYVLTAQALNINKIDIFEHDKVAITYKEAKNELSIFLNKWWSNNDCKPLIPVGKNVAFDIKRLWGVVISQGHWESMVSYQPLDINGAWRLLEAQGHVPVLPKTSLKDIANYFNIQTEGLLHTANGDNLIGIEIMRNLIQL